MFSVAACLCAPQILELTERWLMRNERVSGRVVLYPDEKNLADDIVSGKHFDLYILGITHPDTAGIRLGELIRKMGSASSIVYVTDSEEYAFQAYRLNAIRYLTIPVQERELYSALELAHGIYLVRPCSTIYVKNAGEVTILNTDDIMYVENAVRVMTYKLNNGKTAIGKRRNISFETALEPLAQLPNFIHPHKSYFINMNYVETLDGDSIVMENGAVIPISRKNLLSVRKQFNAFSLQPAALRQQSAGT